MGCKHRKVIGDKTKQVYCQIFNKNIDEYKCQNCLMKIEDNSDFMDYFNEIFRGGFNK